MSNLRVYGVAVAEDRKWLETEIALGVVLTSFYCYQIEEFNYY